MSISIIIPNFNGEELLRKHLDDVVLACVSYKKGAKEIIIVDDHSTDNSVSFLKEWVEKTNKKFPCQYLVNKQNQGFAKTVNRGVSLASNDIIILLNTDVVPQKNFLSPLVEHFFNKDVFAVGCLEETAEKGKEKLYGNGRGLWKDGMFFHQEADIHKKTTLWVSGGSGAFRKRYWDQLGGFDELYSPFYWEDIDLSYRAQKKGWHVLFEETSIVKHNHEKGAIRKAYSSFAIASISIRNQFIFIWKNITDTDLITSHLFSLPFLLLKALLRGDKAFLEGFILAFCRVPQIYRRRKQQQKDMVKKDREIFLRV